MRGANDHLDIRILLPQSRDGLDSIPSRGHSHINKGHGIGALLLQRPANQLDALLSLRGAIELKQRKRWAFDGRTE